MSSAVLERTIEQPKNVDLVMASPIANVPEPTIFDRYPLVPVFIAGAISLVLTGMFIGSILVWLSLRHTGVMAP